MTRPISEDLRRRVIEYIELGNTRYKAANKYEVSYSAVTRWYNRYKETGSYKAIPYPGKKAKIGYAEFTKHVESHPNATLAQLGKHFGISAPSVHYYMKKFCYSYKKKRVALYGSKGISKKRISRAYQVS
jgi:transposase